jgi:hypothetical protein
MTDQETCQYVSNTVEDIWVRDKTDNASNTPLSLAVVVVFRYIKR